MYVCMYLGLEFPSSQSTYMYLINGHQGEDAVFMTAYAM